MAIGDITTDKPQPELALAAHGPAATDANLHRVQDQAQLAVKALTSEWLDSQAPSDLSTGKKVSVLLGAAAQGTLQNGLDEVCNHTWRTTAEVAGAAALGLALRGPVWTRLPAMAVASVGTLSYGQQLVEAGLNTNAIVGRMNSRNLEESRQSLKETLGPVIFNTALMSAAGAATAHAATRLPAEYPQVKVARTLSLAKEHLADMLGVDGFPPGMTPALAGAYSGGGGRGRFNIEAIMPTAKPAGVAAAESTVMQMSAAGGASGSGGSRVYGEGIGFRTARGPQGETFYHVDNLPAGKTVHIEHEGGVITSLTAEGKVMVGFPGGEGRKVDLGQTIRRVVMTEYQHGLKQFRFNDKITADLEVDNSGHSVRALLGNGDHLHMLDNTQNGYMHFAHKDGLQTWVEHGGRVVTQLPNTGTVHEVRLPDKLAFIRMLEKLDGSKEFRFLNDQGKPVAQVIKMPPTPELQELKAADEIQNWYDLRNYIASRARAQQTLHNNLHDDAMNGGGGGPHRIDPSPHGQLYPNHGDPHHPAGPFMLPMSYDRVVARELVGVPAYIMRGNDLSTPADMELAMQGHSWVVTNYLDRLDYQEEVHHHGW